MTETIANTRAILSIIRRIKAQEARIGKERDKLDAMVAEADHILENCEAAAEHLQRARDALSEMV